MLVLPPGGDQRCLENTGTNSKRISMERTQSHGKGRPISITVVRSQVRSPEGSWEQAFLLFAVCQVTQEHDGDDADDVAVAEVE